MKVNNKQRINIIFNKLKKKYQLGSFRSSPYLILIATILSQRTKDENTDRAFTSLFAKYKTVNDIAGANIKDIENLIKPAGFYKVKARRIKKVSEIIQKKYKGGVPHDFDELLKLPGVGRKTANCVLCYGFGIEAIPVDTHVHRISNRLGLVNTKTPEETEHKLKELLPKKYWIPLNELLVKFGKDICRPINPRCGICPILRECKNW